MFQHNFIRENLYEEVVLEMSTESNSCVDLIRKFTFEIKEFKKFISFFLHINANLTRIFIEKN